MKEGARWKPKSIIFNFSVANCTEETVESPGGETCSARDRASVVPQPIDPWRQGQESWRLEEYGRGCRRFGELLLLLHYDSHCYSLRAIKRMKKYHLCKRSFLKRLVRLVQIDPWLALCILHRSSLLKHIDSKASNKYILKCTKRNGICTTQYDLVLRENDNDIRASTRNQDLQAKRPILLQWSNVVVFWVKFKSPLTCQSWKKCFWLEYWTNGILLWRFEVCSCPRRPSAGTWPSGKKCQQSQPWLVTSSCRNQNKVEVLSIYFEIAIDIMSI